MSPRCKKHHDTSVVPLLIRPLQRKSFLTGVAAPFLLAMA
jgi:hypothetical protein